jgi:hypothetical protein
METRNGQMSTYNGRPLYKAQNQTFCVNNRPVLYFPSPCGELQSPQSFLCKLVTWSEITDKHPNT